MPSSSHNALPERTPPAVPLLQHSRTAVPSTTVAQELEAVQEQFPVRKLEERSTRERFGFLCVQADQRLKRRDFRELGDRWVAVIDDRGPGKGPKNCDPTLVSLIAQATATAVDWGWLNSRFYDEMATGASLGARVVIVRIDHSRLSRWCDFINLFDRSGSRRVGMRHQWLRPRGN